MTTTRRIRRFQRTPSPPPLSRPAVDKKTMRISRLPSGALRAIVRRRARRTRYLLTVSVAQQTVTLWEKAKANSPSTKKSQAVYEFRERYVASTSRFGIGQKINSNRTPLGLHRI